jgi:hypothetical protein
MSQSSVKLYVDNHDYTIASLSALIETIIERLPQNEVENFNEKLNTKITEKCKELELLRRRHG